MLNCLHNLVLVEYFGWKVLGSCLYNVQYEVHLENTINHMQCWQKQNLLLFVLAKGFKQENKIVK